MFPWYIEIAIGAVQMTFCSLYLENDKSYNELISIGTEGVTDLKKKCEIVIAISCIFSGYFLLSSIIDRAIITYILTAGSVFLTGILWWIHNDNSYDSAMKCFAEQESNRIAKEVENRRQMERQQQEDRKYNYIINCPLCLGNGECMVIHRNQWKDSNTYISRKINDKPDDWDLRIDEGDHENWSVTARREECPGCKGEGIAHAFFDDSAVSCNVCGGKGRIVVRMRVKKEIGSEEVAKEVLCQSCKCKGSNGQGVAHVKTLCIPDLGSYWDWDDKTRKEERNRHWKFDVVITDQDEDFFGKRELRKF